MRLVSLLWGSVSFHDDVSLPADMCQPSSDSIADVPATPDDVDRWLRSGELDVAVPEPLTVDDRAALRWDVTMSPEVCEKQVIRPAPPWFASGERHRIYAVPTGTDTILVITWGVGWSSGTEEHLDAVNVATDALVRSMRFGK